MSIKVKINKAIGGHEAGDTITVTNKTADILRDAGVIDDTKPAPKAKAEPKADAKND